MKIGDREIGPGHPVFVVAEFAFNHNGSRATALEMVHAAKAAGADAAKVPCISADCFTVPGASSWKGEDQHAMFKRLELSREDIQAIADECRRVGLVFFGTPDCVEHGRWLVDAGAPVLKVGSDDLTNTPLLCGLAALGVPLILSTGMADAEDGKRAIAALAQAAKFWRGRDYCLLYCVSGYPVAPHDAQLRRIITCYGAHRALTGYSDHTEGPDAAALAVALGACLVEKHLTLDHAMDGPDHAHAADPATFAEMVRRIRTAEVLLGDGSRERSEAEVAMRPIARRSIVASVRLRHGQYLTREAFAYKRPGTGLMPYEADKLIGKTLLRDVAKDEQIRLEDVA